MAIVLCLIFSGSAEAQNWRRGYNIHKEAFFDFEHTKMLWIELKTREQNEKYYSEACPDGGPHEAWHKLYDQNPIEARDRLKSMTQTAASQIKRCHDFFLIAYKWNWFREKWAARLFHHKSGFNQVPENTHSCELLRDINIFTGQCNDAPDWRTPKAVAADAKAVAEWEGKPVSNADRLD